MIYIYFSESYLRKTSLEVQAAHFGLETLEQQESENSALDQQHELRLANVQREAAREAADRHRHATISWEKSVFFRENPYQSVSFIYASMYRENVHAIHISMQLCKQIATLCNKNRQPAANNQNRSLFPGTDVPRTYVPRCLCSLVPMFPGTNVPRFVLFNCGNSHKPFAN